MSKDIRLGLRLENDTLSALRELAAALGFISATGRHIGKPSVSAMIDALAAGYLARPDVTLAALRELTCT